MPDIVRSVRWGGVAPIVVVAPPAVTDTPPVSGWVSTMSDISLGIVAGFLAVAHAIGWVIQSPWPMAVAATVGALAAPFLVFLRMSDAYHRRRLSKYLADEAERGHKTGG